MKNYTDELKKVWQSDDLKFIATLKKINPTQGFFNYLTNPSSKRILFYPIIDDVEILEKRVSFFHPAVADLVDEHLYELELEYTDKPTGKNNPYSLRIKNISDVDQIEIKKLLENKKNNVSEGITYAGLYRKTSDVFASFENVMVSESGEIFMRHGTAQKIFVSPKLALKENMYYSFTIKENDEKLPNAIPKSISELNINPYKDYIRLRFERLNNPEANKMIANLMREIGKGMYSSKQRMIFELLQNADDAPGKDKVEFHIDISGDYFFVMHDGAPFNMDDVEAITSAAESTKRGDNKKTGYKGIGFKSVFTDSSEVWIKSGGYQFAFQRNNDYFQDFDKFYFSSERYIKYPEILTEDKLKFRNQRLRFNGSTDIPWQVIPIWQDQLPIEFIDSNFNNFNNPVQFALKLGQQNIEEYKVAIENIAKRPQFLLFLRNTSKFRSPKNGVTILRRDFKHIIEITKRKGETNQTWKYTKQTFQKIPVSDESFSEFNIGLLKQSRINDYNEVTYFFTDLQGREIETIPPKLASANETEISFAFPLLDNKVGAEIDYIKGLPKYSSLFTYLPMEDSRFQLPFLVNADFVPSSDRQKIQGDNLWNKYVIIKVAEMHVVSLSNFASEFLSDNNSYSSYLSLLLRKVLPEDDTAQELLDSYNEKYLQQLGTTPIIVNDRSEIQTLSQTIIDDSGFVNLLGCELFYQVIETDKRLPHSNLDSKFLKEYKYLAVQVVNLEELAQRLTPSLCEQIGLEIASKALYNTPELLTWLNKIAPLNPNIFGQIPFILHNNSVYPIAALLAEEEPWVINKNTKDYESLLRNIGYQTINLQLEKYSEINSYLSSLKGYINDKMIAYEKLASNKLLSSLTIQFKIELIDFFKNSDFMSGIGEKKYFDELRLFVDENKVAKPLRQLITREKFDAVESLFRFRIHAEEFEVLTDVLRNELIQKSQVFVSFLLDSHLFFEWTNQFSSKNFVEYINEVTSIYSWVEKKDEISSADWASIPWLFINDKTRFVKADEVFWSNAFSKISAEDYETIKSILHNADLKLLAFKDCGEIIQTFKLKTDNDSNIDWTKITSIEASQANVLLDWISSDGNFSDFFDFYTFEADQNDLWHISEVEGELIFAGTEKALKAYIQSIDQLSSVFKELDETLCSEACSKIGLLQGDKLLKAIIDSKNYDQNLANYLPSNIPWELLEIFILNLSTFEIKSGTEYNSATPEHIILSNLLRHVDDINSIPEDVQKILEILRTKIIIDQNPLSEFDLSNRIQFGKGDDRKVMNLSDILEEFKGESDVLDSIIESFVSITDKRKLRKLIFKTRQMRPSEVYSKIEAEKKTYYSVHQVVFQILDESDGGNRDWSKQHFDDYWKSQGDEVELHAAYHLFLDLLLSLEFTDIENFTFHDCEFDKCVVANFATPLEKMPLWLEEWLEKTDKTKRLLFISKLGYNGDDSPIVNLRRTAIADTFELNTVIRHLEEAKSNPFLLWNTLEWLSSYNAQIITRNIELIKQINELVLADSDDHNDIIIPVIESIDLEGNRSYKLQSVALTSSLLKLKLSEEFSHTIFSSIKAEDGNATFIDSSCGKNSVHFDVNVVKLTESVDEELLSNDSKLWEAPFYKKWEHFSEYPIYIFNGSEIPYKRTFNSYTINRFTKDLKVEQNDIYYISKFLINDVLNNLSTIFPKGKLSDLKDWHYRTLQNEALLDEDSFDYKEDIDRLLQDKLGISEEDQKSESGNAKTHAVYFLNEEGFDVSNAVNSGAYLTNIVDPDGNTIDCIVRSAKGGLLYLDKSHWDMLERCNTYLVVIYPNNHPRLFKDQLTLLDEKLSENVLFRIPNSKQISEIDGVFEALNTQSHLILVTSEKMKESLFSKLKPKEGFKSETDVAVKGDNFTFG